MGRRIVVYLGLGSNTGQGKKHIRQALSQLAATPGITVAHVSRFVRARPMYMTDQPVFTNAVVRIQTRHRPADLLAAVKLIERRMGRSKSLRYGPRLIDIDILLYGRRIIRTPPLTVPHRLMHERPFVLVPLAEIAPGTVHPVRRETVRMLCNRLRSAGRVPQ